MGPGRPLKLRRLAIDTYQEPVLYLHRDSQVCRSEGFEAQSRVEVSLDGRSIVATLNVVMDDLLGLDEAGVSEFAWRMLGADEGASVDLRHPELVSSLRHVRAKVYGNRLDQGAFDAVITDIAAGRYSNLQLAAFVTACAGERLDQAETTALARAMIAAGERMDWPVASVMDKHCVGGLPGNRTSMIVVPIVAACGLTIPKTSSRAITSPAGTADTMEVLAPVDLSVAAMRRTVDRCGGCVVWGGSMRLSPADDILIRVERPLDLDSEGQLVASVLSKKAAAGSSHVVIDIPVGPTAKVRSDAAAAVLAQRLLTVGRELGMVVRIVLTDGLQPVGRGIGPSLEARDVLAVLQGQAQAPSDLRLRSVRLAGEILEMGRAAPPGQGEAMAGSVLADGRAWKKFLEICDAQGGLRTRPVAPFQAPVTAAIGGTVLSIDNRRLARAAKLAGAPRTACAGLDLHVRLGDLIEPGQPLFTLHADARGELDYALRYVGDRPRIVRVE